jgi:hypothetical protein
VQLVVAQAFLRLCKVRQGWTEEFLALLACSPEARGRSIGLRGFAWSANSPHLLLTMLLMTVPSCHAPAS